MDSVWEFKKICRSELDVTSGLENLPRPVGIVIFGPGSYKKFVFAVKIKDAIENCTINPHELIINTLFETGRSVIKIMDSESSCSHKCRHEVFTGLKTAGAKTLVGVYVKYPDNMDGYRAEKREQLERQFRRLRHNPPTPEGIDYLITITPVDK